jgi:sirohydrochlorin ferrochelatase
MRTRTLCCVSLRAVATPRRKQGRRLQQSCRCQAGTADTTLDGVTHERLDPSKSRFESVGATGVVIIDHGSRRAESNEMLSVFAQLYTEVTERNIVEIAHMEIAEPTLLQAVQKCVGRGAAQIIVAPYFLSNGKHMKVDIPEQISEARARFPSVDIRCADAIGAYVRLPIASVS